VRLKVSVALSTMLLLARLPVAPAPICSVPPLIVVVPV
jgi:hypothetical protein